MRSAHATHVAICLTDAQQGSLWQLCAPLSAAGFVAETLPDLDSAIDWSSEGRAETRLLVWSPPRETSGGPDAAASVRRLRSRGFAAPVVVIGDSTVGAHVAAVLDAGADEYVRTPCDPVEVVARLRALVRRACGLISLGPARDGPVLDRWRHVVADGDAEVALTPREAELLECLAQRAGRPVAREELATCVWGTESFGRSPTNVVDVYVAYLRRKLGTLGRASLIRSVRGIGYELASTSRPASCDVAAGDQRDEQSVVAVAGARRRRSRRIGAAPDRRAQEPRAT